MPRINKMFLVRLKFHVLWLYNPNKCVLDSSVFYSRVCKTQLSFETYCNFFFSLNEY